MQRQSLFFHNTMPSHPSVHLHPTSHPQVSEHQLVPSPPSLPQRSLLLHSRPVVLRRAAPFSPSSRQPPRRNVPSTAITCDKDVRRGLIESPFNNHSSPPSISTSSISVPSACFTMDLFSDFSFAAAGSSSRRSAYLNDLDMEDISPSSRSSTPVAADSPLSPLAPLTTVDQLRPSRPPLSR